MYLKFLCNANKNQPPRPGGNYYSGVCAPYLTKASVGKHDKEEAQHEAVAIVKPVGSLKSVPDKVEGADEKAEHKKHDKSRRMGFFTG